MQGSLFNSCISDLYAEEDFVLHSGNNDAYNYMTKENNNNVIILYGMSGSGKTHLAHIWSKYNNGIFLKHSDIELEKIVKQQNKCIVIEDIHKITNELALLRAYNVILQTRGKLLLTSSVSPYYLQFKTQDLQSRIRSAFGIEITVNGDKSTCELIVMRYMYSRNIHISKPVAQYITKRLPVKQYDYIVEILDIIVNTVLEKNSKITMSFVNDVIKSFKQKKL